MSACFHCDNAGNCNCITCGVESQQGWQSGKCKACEGSALWAAMEKSGVLRGVDPRDRRHWERRGNKRDQGAAKLYFLPEERFKELAAKTEAA